MEDVHFHMADDIVAMMKEPHVEDKHEESFNFQVLVKGDEIEYLSHTFDLLHQYIQEDIPFRSVSKGMHFSMDWIDNYITKMEF